MSYLPATLIEYGGLPKWSYYWLFQRFSRVLVVVRPASVHFQVAPDVGDLRPAFLAGLKARYGRLTSDARVYPPERYPWRRQDGSERDRWRR
jgi:hypothetical protein